MDAFLSFFNPIGFVLPLVFCLAFLLPAVRKLDWKIWLIILFGGLVTFQFAAKNAGGVNLGLGSIYVSVAYAAYIFIWRQKIIPTMAFWAPVFLMYAIPDCILTFQWFGLGGQVGGAGWEDGLMKYWLYPTPLVVLLLSAMHYIDLTSDQKKQRRSFAKILLWHCCLPEKLLQRRIRRK